MGWLCPQIFSKSKKRLFFVILVVAPLLLASDGIFFEKKRIEVGGKYLDVEVADTVKERQLGLMNRTSLPANAGMLFVFDQESVQKFWMKDTFISLSIGFFNKDKILVDIQEMKGLKSIVQKEIPFVVSRFPCQFALEVNRGWFKKNKVKLGQKFHFIK